MPHGRLYQADLTASIDIGEPTGHLYTAHLDITEPPAGATGRIYQARLATAAAAGGTGRIYQARLATELDPAIVPSGIRARRGGALGAVTASVHRGGGL